MNLTNADIKNLKDKKYRKEHDLFLLEGNKFCKDLLDTDIEIIYTISTNKNLKGFPNLCVVSDKQMQSLATTKTKDLQNGRADSNEGKAFYNAECQGGEPL